MFSKQFFFFFQINEYALDHIECLGDAVKFLNASTSNSSILTLTLAKSTNALSGLGSGVGPLSSSSRYINHFKNVLVAHFISVRVFILSPVLSTLLSCRSSGKYVENYLVESKSSKNYIFKEHCKYLTELLGSLETGWNPLLYPFLD